VTPPSANTGHFIRVPLAMEDIPGETAEGLVSKGPDPDSKPGSPDGDATVSAAQIPWVNPSLTDAMLQLQAKVKVDIPVLAAAFLWRHEMNVEKALEALAATMSWRSQSGAAEARTKLLTTELPFSDFPFSKEVFNFLPQCEGGLALDKRGLPYAIRCPGLADAVGLFSTISEDDLIMFQIYLNEWRLFQLEQHALKTGELCGILIVQDMFAPEGLLNAWRKQGKKAGVMRRVTGMMDEHYPGIMEKVLLVNAPWALHALMKVVTPLLPPRIVEKLQFIPVEQTPARLLEYISPEKLPSFLGGDAENDQFVAARAAALVAKPGSELFLKAGCVEEQTLSLEPNDEAACSIFVEGGLDIMLSCCFLTEGGTDQILPASRIMQKEFNFTAPSKGSLVLHFDNTYSWVKPKTIQYELAKLPDEVQRGGPDAGYSR